MKHTVYVITLVLSFSFANPFNSAAQKPGATSAWMKKRSMDGLYKADPGPYTVATAGAVWKDSARDREVPVRIYAPDLNAGSGPFPTIVFSHGFGETKDSYATIGKHWASHGYIVVIANHAGSDRAALRAASRMAASYQLRPEDISFIINRLTSNDLAEELLKGRIARDRIGAAGHSIGSSTGLSMVGLKTDTGPNRAKQTFRDERVKAAIAMSPQIGSAAGVAGEAPSPLDQLLSAGAWDEIRAPAMVMIGTRDTGYGLLQKNPNLRRLVYDTMPAGGKYLVNLVNAQHHAFTDTVPYYGGDERIPAHYGYIQQLTTAFWDAYLKGNQTARAARAWLDHNTLQKLTDNQVLQENKQSSPHSGARSANSQKPRVEIKPRATVRGSGATLDFYPLTKFIQSAVKERRLPGAAMLVVNRYGEVFYEKSFGQFLMDTTVPLGSMNGRLTATAPSNGAANTRDLGKLMVALLNDGEYEGKRVLSAESAYEMKQTQAKDLIIASEGEFGCAAWIDLKHEVGAVFLTYSPAVDFSVCCLMERRLKERLNQRVQGRFDLR